MVVVVVVVGGLGVMELGLWGRKFFFNAMFTVLRLLCVFRYTHGPTHRPQGSVLKGEILS